MFQWYRNLIVRWNHERTLRKFAMHSPFTLEQIRKVYYKVKSYEKLERVLDLALRENLSLTTALFAVFYEFYKETE